MKNEVIDTTDVEEAISVEAKMLEEVIEYVKLNLKWWNLKDYSFYFVKDYMNRLIEKKEMMISKDIHQMDNKRKKELVYKLEKDGYVYVNEDNYYIRILKEHVKKSNEA